MVGRVAGVGRGVGAILNRSVVEMVGCERTWLDDDRQRFAAVIAVFRADLVDF